MQCTSVVCTRTHRLAWCRKETLCETSAGVMHGLEICNRSNKPPLLLQEKIHLMNLSSSCNKPASYQWRTLALTLTQTQYVFARTGGCVSRACLYSTLHTQHGKLQQRNTERLSSAKAYQQIRRMRTSWTAMLPCPHLRLDSTHNNILSRVFQSQAQAPTSNIRAYRTAQLLITARCSYQSLRQSCCA